MVAHQKEPAMVARSHEPVVAARPKASVERHSQSCWQQAPTGCIQMTSIRTYFPSDAGLVYKQQPATCRATKHTTDSTKRPLNPTPPPLLANPELSLRSMTS